MEKKIIQAGTTLQIDEEFHDMVIQAYEEYQISKRELEDWEYNFPVIPVQIVFKAIRVDRFYINLAWYFNDPGLATHAHFALSLFKKLGFEIIEPESEVIDILNADDRILGTRDLVMKHFILQSVADGKTREWCEAVMSRVESSMSKVGAHFYIP